VFLPHSPASCLAHGELAKGGTNIRNQSFWHPVACLVEDYG
ncbi:uncharacterized, partial [Tachysurus ichikawai]